MCPPVFHSSEVLRQRELQNTNPLHLRRGKGGVVAVYAGGEFPTVFLKAQFLGDDIFKQTFPKNP